MAKFLVNIDMSGNEIQNVVLQPLAAAPANPTVGRIYYDTTDSMLKTYDGTKWSAAGAVVSVNGKAGVVVLTQDDVANGSTYVRTHNDLTDALLTLINGALQKSGGTMSGAIAMGSNKITGLANGTAATDAAAFGQIPVATTTSPKMDGTVAVGSETKWAKGDHVHPTDTSRQAKITASGILKGDGSGGVSAAVAGTDYALPSAIPSATTTSPKMDGTAAVGSETKWAKGDHVHPTDTSRQAKITASGILKGNGSGGVSAAVAGTDYALPSAIPEAYTSNPAMDGTASAGSSTKWAKGDHVHPTDTSRMAASLKGAANGVAELDANGKVPSSQLPAYVDDVIEGYYYNSKFYKEAAHTTEIAGETGKIYVDLSTEKTYRWSGTAFVEISASLALGETSSTAYRGDRGKTAYDHSQLTSGNPHNVTKSDVGLGNVDNTSDATKKTNFTGPIADGSTGFTTGDAVYNAIADALDQIPTAYTSNPAMDGTASPGSFNDTYAKGDHVHPTDTSRQAKITASGILKGDGSGGVSAAVAGTDYATPNAIPTAYTSNPAMDGTASAGSSTKWAKGDHVHPTDTSRMAASLKGAANGVAELDANGKLTISELPCSVVYGYYSQYYDEFYNESTFNTVVDNNRNQSLFYCDLITFGLYVVLAIADELYYQKVASLLQIGETSATAYRGDRGKTAYDHSQLTSGNPHNVSKSDVGLGYVDNTSDNTKKSLFHGSISNGNEGFPYGGEVYTALNNVVKTATGTISTSSTTATVNFSGTFINAYATINGSMCVVDITPSSTSVVFTVAAAPNSAVTCVVVYASYTGGAVQGDD